MNGSQMIAAERKRQRDKEGWSGRHDSTEHGDGQLIEAAICYADCYGPHSHKPERWPEWWDWKPKDRIRNLVRAGALIAAEIDRLKRDAAKGGA